MRLRATRWTVFVGALLLAAAAKAAELTPDIRVALDRGDYAAAMRSLQPLAERGDPVAQTNLAQLYRRGLGVPTDFAAAAQWYRKAAEQGDASAQNALGALYGAGLGVTRNYAEAVKWYRLAAEQGAAEHQFDLAMMYDNGLGVAKDSAQAAAWYAKAAEQGFAEAEANLGFLYQEGEGVAKDLGKALALYRRAAEKGNAKAQNNLGVLYMRGEGVEQNYERAVEWYRKSAAQGFAKAITNLGVMYENGFGVERNEDEAMKLYRLGGRQGVDASENALDSIGFVFDKALVPQGALSTPALMAKAEQGDAPSQFTLGWIFSAGPEDKRDLRAAATWYRKAAGQQIAAAMANLALLYIRGAGVPQDYVLGYMWANLAAARGLSEAAKMRDALAGQMIPAQINEAQGLANQMWSESTRTVR